MKFAIFRSSDRDVRESPLPEAVEFRPYDDDKLWPDCFGRYTVEVDDLGELLRLIEAGGAHKVVLHSVANPAELPSGWEPSDVAIMDIQGVIEIYDAYRE
jgi:hypothetical protein